MYEEKKFGWRAYRFRLIIIGLVWLLAIFFHGRMGPPDIGGMWILAIIISLLVFVLGAWENELRYQTPSHIVFENGMHYSFHPFSMHRIGRWIAIAVGGVSAGGIELKGGEGTVIFPAELMGTTSTNPVKIIHVRAAPIKCSEDALPQEVRAYIPNFGELKAPYYFTITPVVESEDKTLKDAIVKLSEAETDMTNLNTQVSERDRLIRKLLSLKEEIRDYKTWRDRFKFLAGGKKEED